MTPEQKRLKFLELQNLIVDKDLSHHYIKQGRTEYLLQARQEDQSIKKLIKYLAEGLAEEGEHKKPQPTLQCDHTHARCRYQGSKGMYLVRCGTCELKGAWAYNQIAAWRHFFNAVEKKSQRIEREAKETQEDWETRS